jgi:hypothetical protein
MRHSGKDTHNKRVTVRAFSIRLGVLTVVLTILGTVVAASASAAPFEIVGHFGGILTKPSEPNVFPEEVQLGNVSDLAVNTTGAGGVAPGTIYAIDREPQQGVRIARFGPSGNFEELWILSSGKRCGPATEEPANPGVYSRCPAYAGGGGIDRLGVDVDQATGNVYALIEHAVGGQLVPGMRAYSPDGTELIAEFGEADTKGTIAQSPGKIHGTSKGGMAVDEAGDVYVFDEDNEFNYRLMLFKPETAGDYKHYVYAGQGRDIAVGVNSSGPPRASEPVLDQAGNIYGASSDNFLDEYDPAHPSTPICTFSLPAGGITTHTVNPLTGEVFYYNYKNRQIHQLACNGEGKFVEKAAFGGLVPERGELRAMTMDPLRKYEPERPAGMLYGATPLAVPDIGSGGEPGAGPLGYILAPPKEFSPSVESESVSDVTSSTASLGAEINPRGTATSYVFQYLDDASYEANDPDEHQSLTVSAADGVFGLGFEGRHLGGPASATLSAGSKTIGALATAKGTATLKGAVGKGTLKGAEGKGTFIAGSNTITSVKVDQGKFEVGQGIAGAGIPASDANGPLDTTIVSIKPEEGLPTFEITISRPAVKTVTGVTITSGAAALTEVSAGEGSFEVGQAIEGQGIPAGTKITAVNPNELGLSRPATVPVPSFALHAGFPVLTAVSPSLGSFEVGQAIEGEGIPAATEILAVNGSELTLSKPVSKPGIGVAISSPGPTPWAVGEQVEGPGVPQGTTITSVHAGEATLSSPATASGSGIVLRAGLPANASAAQVRAALEGLPTIGKGNVRVSGGPGDETGSSPYGITFTGAFENVDVPQLSADASGLSGGSATATVQTEHNGGGGFAGAIEVPAGGVELGAGQNPLSANVSLSGLAPGTSYHFRAIATSHCSTADTAKVCEGLGATRPFRTFPAEAPTLPDERAYELVSPAQKHGGEVIPAYPGRASCGPECKPGAVGESFPQQSSPDGEAVVYMGFPFSFGGGAVTFNEYLSRRDGKAGWQTTTLSPVLTRRSVGQGYLAFDAGLNKDLLYQDTPVLTPDAPSGYANLYSQSTTTPSALTPLLGNAPPNRTPESGGEGLELTYAGASSDLSRIFFEANDALTEETPFAPAAVDGGAKKYNLYEWFEGQLRLVNVAPGNATSTPGAAFGSGGRLEKLAGAAGGTGANPFPTVVTNAISKDGSRVFWSDEAGQLYVREDGESTRQIPDPGFFLSANPEGSEVLLSNGHLYDLETEATTDLTEGKGGFRGISGQSEDLSHIYFVDTEVLDETPNGQGDRAEAGKDNLYSWKEGSSSYVATLASGDLSSSGIGSWAPSPTYRTAEASPDGRWLAFLSEAQPTGYDNVGACKFDPVKQRYAPSAPCDEAYLYDSAAGKLICVSCNPSGASPLGPTRLTQLFQAPGSFPQPRYLTDEGRLYFDSADSLTPFDTNEGVEDVYQYEPEGVGTCTKEGGCVALISAGHEAVDSNLLGIDASGENVFFTSRDQLTLKDKDELVDLYDARERGGIPSETETSRVECQGEACQPVYTAPNDPTPASSSFEGAGNVNEARGPGKHPRKPGKHPRKHKKKRPAKKKHAHKRAAEHNRGGAK